MISDLISYKIRKYWGGSSHIPALHIGPVLRNTQCIHFSYRSLRRVRSSLGVSSSFTVMLRNLVRAASSGLSNRLLCPDWMNVVLRKIQGGFLAVEQVAAPFAALRNSEALRNQLLHLPTASDAPGAPTGPPAAVG
ncbi:uncharacterized protein LOC143421456 [Maylandia zebra]|uniref:uncharacterized protein LOC143421456 n=1 Tax=Maylandia zebra TaxID=106582 RepID=UPI00403D14A6